MAIGAASLVQPELVAGEVALIGKMAADSAKKTVTTIAADTSTKVVKAISKDLADNAKEEAAKDAVAESAKEKAEGPKNGEAATKEAVDPKAAHAEPEKDAPKVTLIATADATSNAKPKGPEAVPTEPLKEVGNGIADNASDTIVNHAKAETTQDRTISIEVAREPSETTTGIATSSSAKSDATATAPVSLKITLGADGEVKAVANGVDEVKPKAADSAPATIQEVSKTNSVEATTKATAASVEITKDKPELAQETSASAPPPAAMSEKKPEQASEVPKHVDDTPSRSSTAVVSAIATVTKTTKAKTISKPVTEDGMVTISQESLDLLHHSKPFFTSTCNFLISYQNSTPCTKQSYKSQRSSLYTCPHIPPPTQYQTPSRAQKRR